MTTGNDLPAGWRKGRLKDVLKNTYSGGTPSASDPQNWTDPGEGTPFVKIGDMSSQPVVAATEAAVTERGLAEKQLRVLPPKTLLFAMYASLGEVAVLGVSATINQAILALLPNKRAEPRWLAYWLQHLRPHLRSYAKSTTQDNLSAGTVWNLPAIIPPTSVQRSMADFLDRETHRIDALVDAKRRLRSRLAEKATAVITHGVTRGRDFSRQMRFVGGLPPLEIPEHWESQRLAVVMKQITNGYVGPTRDILVDNGVRYVQSLHIKEGRIDFHTPYYVSEQWAAARSRTRLRQGDLLLVQTGDIGQSAVVTGEFDGAQCHALIIMRRRRSHDESRYFGYALRSSAVRSAILKTATGALHPHLNVGLVRDVRVPVPPADEQRAIVSWIDRKLDAIDSARKAIDSQLDLLTEYRRALITQAVTGQLDEATLKGDKPIDEAVGVIAE